MEVMTRWNITRVGVEVLFILLLLLLPPPLLLLHNPLLLLLLVLLRHPLLPQECQDPLLFYLDVLQTIWEALFLVSFAIQQTFLSICFQELLIVLLQHLLRIVSFYLHRSWCQFYAHTWRTYG